MPVLSKKHHYLPQCYLKGFVNDDGSFWVYDKVRKKAFQKKSTVDVFQENHRNSFTNPLTGEKEDVFEKLYGPLDTDFGELLGKIRVSDHTRYPLELEERYMFSFCLSALFWRVPSRDEEAKRMMREKGFQSGVMKIRNAKTGELLSGEMLKGIEDFDGMDKAYKMGMQFAPVYEKKTYETARRWRFAYQDPGFYITGDDPIIRRNRLDMRNFLDEFVFPVANNRVLVNTASIPKQESLPEHFALKVGIAILEQSQQYICARTERQINDVVYLHSEAKKVAGQVDLIEYLFRGNV